MKTIILDIQRVRNLTTEYLHTKMADIYEDLERITGHAFFTHQLPNAARALEPFLRVRIPDSRFWDDQFDPTHVGTIEIVVMDPVDQQAFDQWFAALPSLLEKLGTKVV